MRFARFSSLCMAVAVLLSGAVSITSNVKGVDTSNTWFTPISGDPGVEFRDAEWAPGGSHALFVGYDTGNSRGAAYWYNPLDENWFDITITNGSADGLALETVEFWNDRMVVMGDCGPAGTWFYTNPADNSLVAETDVDLAGAYVYDLMYIGGTMFASGQAAGGYALTWYNNGTGWQSGWGDATKTDAKYYGMDWYSWGANVSIYMVGSYDDAGTTRGLYQEYNVTPMTITNISQSMELIFTDIELDTSVPASPRMLITASQRGPGTYGIYSAEPYNGSAFRALRGQGIIPVADSLYGIDVDAHGTAVAVGWNPTEGVVYNLWRTGSQTTVLIRSDASTMFQTKHFNDVRIRPYGVQMALTVGSAFRFSYTSVLAPIQVDTSLPHISYIHLFAGDDVGTSCMNSQIDVDAGAGTTYYTISVCFWDNLGIDRVTAMNIWVWYDMGLVGQDIPAGFDDAALANQRMRFAANNGGVPTLEFPLTGETTLSASTWEESDVYGWVNVTFVPREQVRWADSDGAVWNQGAATDRRYDGLAPFGVWNAEDQSDNVGFAPLDEDLTWDIKVQIQDDAPATNYAYAYDEFGFFKYTYLGSENIVNGGSIYGSGAPSTPNVALSPSNVDITFRANCPYRLGVTLHGDLTGVAVPANTIDGDTIDLQGGDLARTAFAAGGSTQYLIGAGPLQDPLGSGTSTTTSSYDDNADSDAVFWWCNIPGVPEDQYVNQITWALEN